VNEPESPLDPSRIEPPPTPPSDTPDPRARDEEREYQRPKLTPTDRLENALKDHIASLEGDKERLAGREAEQSRTNLELRSELDRLRPELAELKQARRVAGWVGTLTTLFMFLGSCLISHAGTLPDGEAKLWDRALGWGFSIVGGLVTVVILIFGWPPKAREGSQLALTGPPT
jgi:hypothetical protein